ncbi:hypothetical protein K3172_14170 [Qipengyuania sp. 6B39]|uniref:hypothetical protein n=1 Tax=Qipengyuania proteolytica TaxID=2867239 RepID=UPI001C897E1E|nr:hypothetical protein [Qipengyuania proteolytica]MBX7497004.1 hypothetical protein [Qipengyuania proteolytica]
MDGYLFIVEPDTSTVIGRCCSLAKCRDEAGVEALMAQWQAKVGDRFVVKCSLTSPEWTREVEPAAEAGNAHGNRPGLRYTGGRLARTYVALRKRLPASARATR